MYPDQSEGEREKEREIQAINSNKRGKITTYCRDIKRTNYIVYNEHLHDNKLDNLDKIEHFLYGENYQNSLRKK